MMMMMMMIEGHCWGCLVGLVHLHTSLAMSVCASDDGDDDDDDDDDDDGNNKDDDVPCC